jgi:hypothetical protein
LITDGSCEALAGEGLRHLIERTRARLEAIDASERTWLGGYVEALIDPIGEAGWPITGRRASYLHANALAVAAACSALGNEASLEDAAFLAVKWSLPQRARGTAIDETKLAAVHRSALVQAGTPERSFWQSLRRIADPLERLARVVKTPASDVDVLKISALVSDLWAGFSLPQRYVLSRHVLPHLAAGSQVTVPCYEAIAEPVLAVQAFTSGGTHKKDVARIKVPEHQHVITVARKLAERGEDGVQLGNTLLALLFGSDEPFDADTMVEFDRRCATLFGELAGQSARSEQAA